RSLVCAWCCSIARTRLRARLSSEPETCAARRREAVKAARMLHPHHSANRWETGSSACRSRPALLLFFVLGRFLAGGMLALAAAAPASAFPLPKGELRGLWVVRTALVSPQA